MRIAVDLNKDWEQLIFYHNISITDSILGRFRIRRGDRYMDIGINHTHFSLCAKMYTC